MSQLWTTISGNGPNQPAASLPANAQEILKFSAAGKVSAAVGRSLNAIETSYCLLTVTTIASQEAKKINKWRLVSLDAFDLTVYGGNDDSSDNVFTKIIINYPLSKIRSCKPVRHCPLHCPVTAVL